MIEITNIDWWKDVFYFFRKKAIYIICGKIKKNLIYAFWGKSINNFGDLLTPLILKHYGLTPVHAYPNKAQIVSVGTLLGYMSNDFKGIIMGTGINNPSLKPFNNAVVVGLRGKLTQDAIGLNSGYSIVLGDPGLLASRIFPKRENKRWKLGIVPHLSELQHPIVKKWEAEFSDEVKIINVLRNPEIVIKEIDACEHIISSSLHGLIIADSLEIPNIRYIMPDASNYEYEHNYFRFDDYYSVLEVTHEFIAIKGDETERELMVKFRTDFSMLEPIKDNLDEMLRGFVASYLRNK